MQNEHEQIDQFLRDATADARFDFQESYWERMSAMLDEQDAGKRPVSVWRKWLKWIIPFIVLVAAWVAYSVKTNTTHMPTTSKHALAATHVDSDVYTNPENDATIQSTDSHITSTTKLPKVATSNVLSVPTTAGDQLYKTKRLAKNTATNNIHTVVNNPKATAQPTPNNFVEDTSSIRTEKSTPMMGSQTATADPNNDIDLVTPLKQKATTRAAKASVMASHKKNMSQQRVQPARKQTTSLPKENLSTRNPLPATQLKQTQSSNIVMVQGKPMQAVATKVYKSIDPEESNPRYVKGLGNYVPQRYDSVIEITYQPVRTQTTAGESDTPPAPAKFVSPWVLHVMAGAIINSGWQSSLSSRVVASATPFITAGLEKKISAKIAIASQVGFTTMSGLNTEMHIHQTQYAFGGDSTTIAIRHKTMYQLYIPLLLGYDIHPKHQIWAGAAMTYLMNVSGTYETTTTQHNGYNFVANKPNYSLQTQSKNNQFGYIDGFNRLDALLQLGYIWKFHPLWSVNLFYQQGVSDITRNQELNGNFVNRQSRLMLGLKYSFSRNK